MNKNTPACVLTIAGTDPSGGAGLQADIKTISAQGCYAASVVTALVAQNTQGVQAIEDVSPRFIQQQLESVFNDLNISAVKIGMLNNIATIKTIADALQKLKPQNIVLDPVMVAKSGYLLLSLDAIDALKNLLFPLATVITPNLFEAECLLQIKINTTEEMESAVKLLAEQYHVDVLLKGGHLQLDIAADVLYMRKPEPMTMWFHAERINSKHTHGTGCTLSSAIAAQLAKNNVLVDAVKNAKQYLTHAIESARSWQIGKGNGPVDHFYFLEEHYG